MKLLNVPVNQTSTVAELLSKDRENAYRSLFGPSGDGISEMLTFSVVMQSRKEIL